MKSRNLIIGTGALIAIGLLASAFSLKTKRTIPEGAHAVTPFDADKYLGTEATMPKKGSGKSLWAKPCSLRNPTWRC